MRIREEPDLVTLGLAAALAGFSACSSGGYIGDGVGVVPRDGGITTQPDLRPPADLRRPLSSELSLGMPKTYPVGSSLTNLIVYDMNGDGLLDIVGSGGGTGVLLGKGDGTFQTAQNVASSNSSGFAVGDINGDAKPDLAMAYGGNARVFLGNGNGTFQTPLNMPIGSQGIGAALGDVNRDGKLDLAIGVYVSGVDNFVHVLPGMGNGTFGSPVKVQVGRNTQTVRLVDLNRDGKLDLAVANYESSTVTVALGNGDGTFVTPQQLPSEQGPIVVDAVDMNLDGVIDLVVSSESRPSFSVHRGKGDGTFEMPQASTILGDSYGLAAGDLNGDAVPDVVTCSASSSMPFSVALGKGDGSFLAPRSFGVSGNTFTCSFGDFNRDGLADIVVGTYASPGQVYVLLNTTASP